jgi:Trypsin-like peptidase domain
MSRSGQQHFRFRVGRAIIIVVGAMLVISPVRAEGPVSGRPAGDAMSVEAIAKRALPAVVTVVIKDAAGQIVRSGSGFFVAARRVVTNLHVVAGDGRISVMTTDGHEFPIVSVRTDEQHDLALLDCPEGTKSPMLRLGDSSKVAIGEPVVAVGSPLGMPGTVSTGIVSAARTLRGNSVLQTTAPISPGSSGGPLIDAHGDVIGVISFQAVDGQNLNFAQLATHVAALLRGGGKAVDLRRQHSIAAKPEAADPNQDALIGLLAQPLFSGPEFRQLLIGSAQLALFDVRRQRVYFSLSQAEAPDGQAVARVTQVAAAFMADTDRAVLGRAEGLQARFPDYSFPRSPEKWAFFATNVSNLRLGKGGALKFAYKSAEYTVTSGELKSFVQNASIKGGPLKISVPPSHFWQSAITLKNSGAFVARPGEPSLSRLVKTLTAGIADLDAQIERLATFVSVEIETEAESSTDITKKAPEVLMTRRGTMTHKAILLASLLEQLPADYILVYSAKDAWVATPQGKLRHETWPEVSFDSKPWTVIDVSSRAVAKGQTPQMPAVDDLMVVQVPARQGRFYVRASGAPIAMP